MSDWISGLPWNKTAVTFSARGRWPCDPERLCRSGVPYMKQCFGIGCGIGAGIGLDGWRRSFDTDCESDHDSDPGDSEQSPRFAGQAKATASSRGW